jgi:hypothetical protein
LGLQETGCFWQIRIDKCVVKIWVKALVV